MYIVLASELLLTHVQKYYCLGKSLVFAFMFLCVLILLFHMNLSISIRRSISIHVSISITMRSFACLLGWS